MIPTNIRIYSCMIRINIQIYLYQKIIQIWYKWIFVLENIQIYKNIHKQILILFVTHWSDESGDAGKLGDSGKPGVSGESVVS